MRFRWDWLRAVAPVPYVPTIGPVHPDSFGPATFIDVCDNAGKGTFLPYDKDRRWGSTKDESVLVEDLVHEPHGTLIPTLSQRGGGTVSVYLYGNPFELAADLAASLARAHNATTSRVVSFHSSENDLPDFAAATRVQLREFTRNDAEPVAAVRALNECPPPAMESFVDFAESQTDEGFTFLVRQMNSVGCGPILVTLVEGRVVGAIGPLEIMPDAAGAARLLPQYFAVLPDHRGRGLGRALWRAAMHWGATQGAAYQLLQTVVGGPSDRLCAAEGCRSLGIACVSKV